MTGRSRQACDVLILGAGPAGCATAMALTAAGVGKVLLLDRSVSLPFRIGESATPDVDGLLARLGLEKHLERFSHLPYHGNLSLWGGGEPQLDHFLFRGKGHGWHLDRAAFDASLRQEAVARGAQLASLDAIDAIAPNDNGWRVSARGLGEIHARVVVDAAGRRSPLAVRLGVKRRRVDSLLAIAAHTDSGNDLAGLSLVESFADGWWYAAVLPGGRTLVTLMTDQDIAKMRGFHDPEIFLQAWRHTRLLAHRVAPPASLNRVDAFAAHSGCIECAAGSCWIAVGDALMGLDPLTSAGICGALDDALAAAPAILQQLDGRTDAARDYVRRANSTFKRFLSERQKYYGAERNWPENAFWSRRAGQAS